MDSEHIEKNSVSTWHVSEAKKFAESIANFQDTVFSLAEALTGDDKMAADIVNEVMPVLGELSKTIEQASLIETMVHRLTYEAALRKLVGRHRKRIQ